MFFLVRPTLLVPVWTLLFLGWITAQKRTPFLQFDIFSPFGKMFLVFTAVVGCIYIVNQIADRESDKINNKLFILSNNCLPVCLAWILAALLFAFSLLGAWFWLDLLSFLIVSCAALTGFFYNCPPLKLKDRPWGGFLANCFGYGILTYYAGWYTAHLSFTDGVNLSQPLAVPAAGFFYALSAGFANGAVYLTTTISDMKGDEKVNKRTFAVAYGAKNTTLLATLCVIISFFTAFLIPNAAWTMAVPSGLCIPLFYQLHKSQKIDLAFKTFRYPVVILSAVTAVFVPAYGIFAVIIVILSRIYYKNRFNLEYPSFRKE